MSSSSSSRAERAAAARAEQERKEKMRQYAGIGVVLLVLALIAGGTYWALRDSDQTSYSGEGGGSEPSGVSDYTLVVGEDDAPTTLTIYEDMICPFCGQFERGTRDAVKDGVEAGRVKVEYHVLGMLDTYSTNEYSTRAANALVATYDLAGEDAFLALKADLFDNQPAEGGPGFEDDELIAMAVDAGADEGEISDAINDKAYGQWVVDGTDAASKDGINSTPTVLIDGEPAPGETIEQLIGGVVDAVSK